MGREMANTYYVLRVEPRVDSEGNASVHGHFRDHRRAWAERDRLAGYRPDLAITVEMIRPLTRKALRECWGRFNG